MINGLEITDVKVFPLKEMTEGGLFAFAKIVFNNVFVVTGIKVLEGDKGVYLRFPQQSKRKHDGSWEDWDIAYPISKDMRIYINEVVFSVCDCNRT